MRPSLDPRSTVFGIDAYPDVWQKAASLLHSLARNHALVDGNKRTAWAAAWVFLGCNGISLRRGFAVEAAYDLVVSVAIGETDALELSVRLRAFAT